MDVITVEYWDGPKRKLLNALVDVNLTDGKNSTTDQYLNSVKVDVKAVLPVYLIVLAACLVGNILVCITVMKNNEMRRKRWYYFLMNLSVADMGFALITPVHLLQSAGVDMGDAGCKLGIYIIDIFIVISILTLSYISIDRYICICHSTVGYTKRFHPIKIISAMWLLATVFLIPFLVFCRKSSFKGNSCDCRSAWPNPNHYRAYKFALCLWFYIPFSIMIFCYTKITLHLWGKKGERSSIQCDQSGKKKRSIKMMILATSLFFISWFPYTVLYLLKEMKVGNPSIIGNFWLFIQLIAFANSAWNPFTYCVYSTEFRKGFKKIFFWRKNKSDVLQEGNCNQMNYRDILGRKSADESDTSSQKTVSEVI